MWDWVISKPNNIDVWLQLLFILNLQSSFSCGFFRWKEVRILLVCNLTSMVLHSNLNLVTIFWPAGSSTTGWPGDIAGKFPLESHPPAYRYLLDAKDKMSAIPPSWSLPRIFLGHYCPGTALTWHPPGMLLESLLVIFQKFSILNQRKVFIYFIYFSGVWPFSIQSWLGIGDLTSAGQLINGQKVEIKINIHVEWVKAHKGTVGNKLAEALAKRGTITVTQGCERWLPISNDKIKQSITSHIDRMWQSRWARESTCKVARAFLPEVDGTRLNQVKRESVLNLQLMMAYIGLPCRLTACS